MNRRILLQIIMIMFYLFARACLRIVCQIHSLLGYPPLTTHAPTPIVKAFQTACIDTGTNTFRVCA